MVDSCMGLAVLHSCELVHCDVKPGNILLGSEGQAAVADFGLSMTRSRDQASEGSMAGTPGYTDPYWSIDASYTASSDIYALGVVLLQVLLGEDNIDENDQSIATRHATSVNASAKPEVEVNLEPNSAIGWPKEVAQSICQIGLQSLQFRRAARPTIGQARNSLPCKRNLILSLRLILTITLTLPLT